MLIELKAHVKERHVTVRGLERACDGYGG